jgi:hypothetical protein
VVKNINGISLALSLLITVLFYRQYKVYEHEIEKEEMLEQLINK